MKTMKRINELDVSGKLEKKKKGKYRREKGKEKCMKNNKMYC